MYGPRASNQSETVYERFDSWLHRLHGLRTDRQKLCRFHRLVQRWRSRTKDYDEDLSDSFHFGFNMRASAGFDLWSLIAVFFLELIVNVLFARFVYFNLLGKDFRGMLIAVGGLAFSMGMAANGLSNMQSLCEKYGPNTDGFLVVCVVGLILLAISNTLLIKFLLTIF